MNRKNIRQGYCPDLRCSERFVFDQTSSEPIRCHFCGNWCDMDDLKWVSAIDVEEAKRLKKRIDDMPIREDPEWTRLNGLSQFTCKLISPLFSLFGIDRDWRAVPLHDLGFNGFDYRLLANRSFAIKKKHLYSPGYGIDTLGAEYLSEKLNKIKTFKDDNLLVPLKVSAHSISLLQCFSRALVGREIFLNPLLDLLTSHFQQHESWYLNNLQEFGFLKEEWKNIVQEYNKKSLNESIIQSKYDSVRIFALSNILCRPVVLLNAKKKKSQRQKFDSQLFLPILRKDEERRRKGVLIQPLVVAWNGDSSTSQIVPLVRMTGKPAPMLRHSFLPESFLCKKDLDKFIDFDSNGLCCVADGRFYKDVYKLVVAMSSKYLEKYGVDLLLVNDFVEDLLKDVEYVSDELPFLISLICKEKRLRRCLICWRLSVAVDFPETVLHRYGILYETILKKRSYLSSDVLYTFGTENLDMIEPFGTFSYDPIKDRLEIVELYEIACIICRYNCEQLRPQNVDGRIEYINGDHTRIPSSHALCKRKMKHFWKGKFVDNPPLIVNFNFEFMGARKNAFFEWFEFESKKTQNSNYFTVVKNLFYNYFPDMIFDKTQALEVMKKCQQALAHSRQSTEGTCTETLWNLNLEKQAQKYKMLPKVATTYFEYWIYVFKTKKLYFKETTKKKLWTLGDVDMEQNESPIDTVESSNVRFVLSNGRQGMVVIRKYINYAAISELISAAFGIETRDVLAIFHGMFKMLRKSKGLLYTLQGTAFVLVRTEYRKEYLKRIRLANSPQKICVEASNSIRMHSLRLLYDSLESNQLFWNFVEKSTEMFQPKGTVYEFAKISMGLRNNQHISLPGVFPSIKLVYSIVADCFLYCQDNSLGHIFIAEGTFDKVRLEQFGQKYQLIAAADSIEPIAC